jgi:hypothetical protein
MVCLCADEAGRITGQFIYTSTLTEREVQQASNLNVTRNRREDMSTLDKLVKHVVETKFE